MVRNTRFNLLALVFVVLCLTQSALVLNTIGGLDALL